MRPRVCVCGVRVLGAAVERAGGWIRLENMRGKKLGFASSLSFEFSAGALWVSGVQICCFSFKLCWEHISRIILYSLVCF